MVSLTSLLALLHDGLSVAGAGTAMQSVASTVVPAFLSLADGHAIGHAAAAAADSVVAGALTAGNLAQQALGTVVSETTTALTSLSHTVASVVDGASSAVPPPASGSAVTPADGAAAASGAAAEPSSLGALAPYLKYGPWAILIIFILSGVGLHLSEDFVLVPAGFLIAHGQHLNLWETLIAAYVGLVIGDVLWIWMCRRFGTRMVQSRWFKRIVHPRRLLEAKHQMEERGIIVVVLARFIPGTRTPVITMAGILHMKWWKLITVELTTCAITVPFQIGIGYLAGKGLGESKSTGELVIKLIAATAAFILLGLVIHWWVQTRKRAGRAPRSKASWLRKFGRRRREAAVPTQAAP